MAITFATERISPRKAREYLERNIDNYRVNIRRSRVEAYARAMRSGHWEPTAELIKFAPNGNLLDGQHRLHAVVASGKTVTMGVARGVPDSAAMHMDTGANRNFKDVLAHEGYKHTTQLAAAIRWCCVYESGDLALRRAAGHGELKAWLDAHPEIVTHVDHVRNHPTGLRGVATVAIATRHYTAAGMPGEADAFYESLRNGAGLDDGNPILTLRRRLEWNQNRTRMDSMYVVQALYIKAFNAWIEGREIHKIGFRPGGNSPEDFPRILEAYPGATAAE